MEVKCENCIHATVCDLSAYAPDEAIVCSGYEEETWPRGEWLESEYRISIINVAKQCSRCKAHVLSTHMLYCGNCGANMKEGDPDAH